MRPNATIFRPFCARRTSSRPRWFATHSARTIEIEAKFPFQEVDVARIAAHGHLKGTKIFTDIYWDEPMSYRLTTQDMWLRQRERAWELKVPLTTWRREKAAGPSSIDQYKEIAGERDIASFLLDRGLIEQPLMLRALEDLLRSNNFASFGKITTERLTYECEGVTVTFDTATPLNYRVGEVEVMVDASTDVSVAEARIRSFAQKFNLSIESRLRGKVLELIKRSSARHWQMLRESGQLKSKNVNDD